MDDENSDPVVAACLGFRKEAPNNKKNGKGLMPGFPLYI